MLGLLALLPAPRAGSRSRDGGLAPGPGKRDPLAFPLPSLVPGAWYTDTEVVATGVVQDLVVAEIERVLSVGLFLHSKGK